MSTPVRYDQQYCPIARGLDMLGDRWTLLIVRELSTGPQRFSDLQRHLPGIAATVLSDRLRTMIEDELVETVPDSSNGRRNHYALGPLGRRALPVLASLVRFGMPLLEPTSPDIVVRPTLAVRGAILAYHDPVAASGIDEHYELHVDDERFTIDAHGTTVAHVDTPDGILTAPASVLIDVRQHRATFGDLLRRHVISWAGTTEALTHFRAVYRLDATRSRRRALDTTSA